MIEATLEGIKRLLVGEVRAEPRDVARRVGERLGLSRQAVNRHLRQLVASGLLIAEGETRNRTYRLAVVAQAKAVLPIDPSLAEDQAWRAHALPVLAVAPDDVRDVCEYGFTEIVNNAKDHSGSPTVGLSVERDALSVTITVTDEGVGVYRKIKEAYGLEDERYAVFELSKGRLTTDPEHHTGEGLFFACRMFDRFSLRSGGLDLVHGRDSGDVLLEVDERRPGTTVTMTIALDSPHTLREVFDRYAGEQDDYAFRRTQVVVALARLEGETLVSRSHAKRVLARLDRFREVTLDFRGVETIGPAFADEIFRVFARAHPGVRLDPIRASDDVQRMIRRARTAS